MLKPYIRVLMLCNLSMMAIAIATNLPPVYFTTFSRAFGGEAGLTAEQLGRIGAFIFAGYVIGLMLSAPLADRLGAKPFVLLGNAILAASLIGMAVAINYVMLLTAVLCMGIGSGIIELITSPVVSVLEPDRRTNALNMLHAFYSLGAILTILAASLLIYLEISWRLTAAVMAMLPLLAFLGFTGVKLPPLVHEERRTTMRTLVRQKFFIFTLVAIALCGASELGMVQWLPAYAEKGLGFPRWIGGISLVFFYVGMFAGRSGAAYAAHKISPFLLEAACCVLAALAIIGGALIPQPIVALLACVAVGFAVSCLWPTMLGITASEFPQGGASMFGVLAACGNSGGLMIAWLIGIIADLTSLRIGLAFAGLAPLLLLAVVAILAKHEKPRLAATLDQKTGNL